MSATKITYYSSTTIILLLMVIAGYYDASGNRAVIEYAKHLGYPSYFIEWIGWCKIIGVILFLIPKMPRLREWCYAGFSFELLSGLISHIVSKDAFWIVMMPVCHFSVNNSGRMR